MKRIAGAVFISAAIASALVLTGCEGNDAATSTSESSVEQVSPDTKDSNEQDMVYKYDKVINDYITVFNKLNSDHQIVNPQPYEHHASTHENQVNLNFDGFDVTIGHEYEEKCSVFISCYENKKENDETKEAFVRFIMPFVDDNDESKALELWSKALNEPTNTYADTSIEINMSIDPSSETIDYLKIISNHIHQ